jgi:chondroitin AC lyase
MLCRINFITLLVISLSFLDDATSYGSSNDMQIIMNRLKAEAMIGVDSNVISVQEIVNKIQPDGHFEDLKYEAGTINGANDVREHGQRMHKLAQFYFWNNSKNRYYHDKSLKMKIKQGWDYLAYKAPENILPAWWWIQKVGVPITMWQGLILAHEEIDSQVLVTVLDKYYKKTGCWLLEDKKDNNAGGNLTDRAMAAIAEAILRNDPNRVREISKTVENEIVNYDGWYGSGLQPDYSMHQHPIIAGGSNPMRRVQLYTGGYGAFYAMGLAKLTVWLRGTDFAFSSQFEDQVLHFVLDGQQWFMRDKTFEPSSIGRGITRKGIIFERAEQMKSAAQELLILNKRKDDLQKCIARIDCSDFADENYLHGNRCFWTSDFMVHHRKKFMASVRMVSERTLRPETFLAENKKGYFLGDGYTTIIKDGDEYGRKVGQEIFPVWDWLLLPGTTIENLGTVPFEYVNVCDPENNPNLAHHTGTKKFVGGLSDGEYGMAVMDFGRQPVNVTAKKAWFFFDDEFVALGTAINAANAGQNNHVRTCVNQVLQDGQVEIDANASKVLEPNSTINPKNIRWVYHDGIGYIFLDNGNDVFVSVKKQTGKWEDVGLAAGYVENDVFSIWIDHGVRPLNAEYAYIVAPGITKIDMSKYYESLPIEVLCNNSDIQAVRHKQNKITQASFYKAGLLKIDSDLSIEVDQPCAIMIRQNEDNNITVTASNPKHEALLLHVDINAKLYGENVECIKDKSLSRITFDLPGDLYAGSSQVKRLKMQPE